MIRWARARGDLDENLAEGMRRPTETVDRDRVLSPDEIRTFWQKLADAEMHLGTVRLLKLCLATMARVGEVAGMSTAELQLDRKIWTIPPERSKNKLAHVLPLSDLAVELINEQLADIRQAAAKREARLARRIARAVGGALADIPTEGPEWVFPAPGARSPITEFAPSKAIKGNREHLSIESFVPHDLRRTAATRMEEIGISPFIVSHLLGHISVTKASITSRVYARYDYAREKREAINKWGVHLWRIVEGGAAVLPLFDRERA